MKRRSRWKLLWVTAVLVALYAVLGFFVAPPVLKSQIEKRLTAALNRQVTVGKVRLNPFALSLTIDDFAVQEPDNSGRFLGWRRLYVNLDGIASLEKDWVITEITLDGFSGHVVVNPDRSLNFSDILERLKGEQPPGADRTPARGVRIGLLHVTEARIDFLDLSRAQRFATTLGPVTFALARFRTVSPRGAPYSFEAVTESGERFGWSGELRAQPFRSAGEFRIENIQLPKYAPYYSDWIRAQVTGGRLSARAQYEVALLPGRPVARITDGTLQLRDLQVREHGRDAPVLELPTLDIAGALADTRTNTVTLGAITVAGGHARLRREKDGTWNVLALVGPLLGSGASAARPPRGATAPGGAGLPPTLGLAAAAPPSFDLSIGGLAVRDFNVDITDLTPPQPVQISMTSAQALLRNVSLAEGVQIPVQFAFGWAPEGTVRLDGNVGLHPLKATLNAEVSALALAPLAPYLEQFARARITHGALSASLNTTASLPPNGPMTASVAGTVSVDRLAVVDTVHNEELAGFGTLALHGLRFSLGARPSLMLDAAVLESPYARLVMDRDKTLNVLTLALPGPAPAKGAPAAGAPTGKPALPPPVPAVHAAKITIVDASFRFTDRSVDPNVTMALDQFGGTITGLSSTEGEHADVNLKGTVGNSGPVAIVGQLEPIGLRRSADLKINVNNLDLVPLSPYSAKYAGFELARGSLVLDSQLRLNGPKIDAANAITLNQLTFGPPVKSPDATTLPVRFGVALLKDAQGRIVLNIPVQGSTSDPNFRIAHVASRVVVNLLTKAATSPFALLGAAFGGGGEELSYQAFAPGSDQLEPKEAHKLETVARALTNRPALALSIVGGYDAAADTAALERVKFEQAVRRTAWVQQHPAQPNLAPPEQLALTPEERNAAIRQLFDERFPRGAEVRASAPPAPLPPVVTEPPPIVSRPPPEHRGFFARLFAALTFQRSREKQADERANEQLAAEQQATERRLTEQRQAEQRAAAPATTANTPTGEIPLAEMTRRLTGAMTVDASELQALAQARAGRVRDYFLKAGGIAPGRVTLASEPAAPGKEAAGPRVLLQLQ